MSECRGSPVVSRIFREHWVVGRHVFVAGNLQIYCELHIQTCPISKVFSQWCALGVDVEVPPLKLIMTDRSAACHDRGM